MTVKIHVVYCGAWGYGPRFQKLKKQLEQKFPGKCAITGEATPQSTGWFEVTVNGQLVHSKKNGEGYVDNDKKLQKIYDAVAAAK